MLAILRRLGERCSDLSEEYIHDPYVIAILLTFIAAVAAPVAGASLRQATGAWNRGVRTLLSLVASIALLLTTGGAIATLPEFTTLGRSHDK